MSEIMFLNGFLILAIFLAPFMTNQFFLNASYRYSEAHKFTLLTLAVGYWLDLRYAVLSWPVFCLFGFSLYLKQNLRYLGSPQVLAGSIPFVFSLISALWLVSGFYDLRLLGYNQAWSYYAALHGCYLGWLLVGCFTFLAKQGKMNSLYLTGCFLSFALFLLIAFGIDGIPYFKRIGVIGFFLMIPFLIGRYAFHGSEHVRVTRLLALSSFVAIALSMTLALLNEFLSGFPRFIFNLPIMVLTHGFLNALVAVPCFYLALRWQLKHAAFDSHRGVAVILFDDVCVLCNRTVELLLRLDQNRRLKYSSLQGQFAAGLRASGQLKESESVIFCQGQTIRSRADVVMSILCELGGLYKILGLMLDILPRSSLNLAYHIIAKYRYRWFGKNDSCFIPSKDTRDLFLP